MEEWIRPVALRARVERLRQRRRLARTLRSARALPGYRDHPSLRGATRDPYEALRALPVLERSLVQADPDAFCDPAVASVALTSSGSTGTPLALRLDRRARWRRRRQFALFFLANGWLPWRRSVSLKVVTDPSARLGSGLLDRSALRRRMVVSVLEPPRRQFEAVRCADPEILHGPPSALEELARRGEAAGWRPRRLRRVFTVSESLTPAVRELIERALGAPVLDSYAASEALVGWECSHRSGIHVVASNVLLEVVDEDGAPTEPGEVGQVLITTLDNDAMPLLRYAIGDMAIAPGDAACPCGRPGLLVPRVLGREVPLFRVGGDRVSPWGVLARMHELADVGQFQLVEEGPDRLLALVRPRRVGEPVDRAAIVELAQAELGGSVRIEVREVERIEPAPSGKAAPALVTSDSAPPPDSLAR